MSPEHRAEIQIILENIIKARTQNKEDWIRTLKTEPTDEFDDLIDTAVSTFEDEKRELSDRLNGLNTNTTDELLTLLKEFVNDVNDTKRS